MAEHERILVFCASSGRCDPAYHDEARRLGELLAEAGLSIVYGGGGVGSMGALADGALSRSGEVVGIQPHFMAELEWSHPGISALHLVDDMQERKRRMLASCDAVVALPGGTGTLEELYETLTAKRLGNFHGPVVLVNQRGFFDPCIAMLERCVEESFMDDRHRELWQVVERVDEVIDTLRNAPAWPADARRFASL